MNRLAPTHVGALMLGALVLVFGIGAFKLGFWMDEMPGPGLLPMAAVVLLIPVIVVILREPAPADETPFTLMPLLALAVMGVFGLLLPHAGVILAMIALVIAWVRFFHQQTWLRAVICSVGLTAAAVFIFGVLLEVRMQLLPAWPQWTL
jgi:putative tricarboxylic transport membrane protein